MNLFYMFISILLTILSCKNSGNYPKVILENELETEFNEAKYEIYRLSTNAQFSCSAIDIDPNNDNLSDSMNILLLDLHLRRVTIRHDTISFYFSFYSNEKSKQYFYVHSDERDCYEIYGVQFIQKQKNQAFWGEEGIFNYSEDKSPVPESQFVQYIRNAPRNSINNWLQDYTRREK